MAMEIDEKYHSLLKEALGEYQYKLALELNALKGHALTERRKNLTQKQRLLEELLALLNS
ncbi:MAG: hypothetical protein P1U56_19115 [Saprospiraceae bacterium]|nr:hypothetical protein [Saprospiraceae bacterium]